MSCGALMPRGVIDSLAVVGTADQVAARFKALESAGIGEVVIWPFPAGGQTTEQFIERVATSVMPKVCLSEDDDIREQKHETWSS